MKHLLLRIITGLIVGCSLLSALSAFGDDAPETTSFEQFRTNLQAALNSEEKQWLREHRTVRIAGPRAFPPFFFYDGNLQAQGIAADYSSLILDALGVAVEIRRDLPWPEVMKQAKQNEIDLITLAGKTVERESFLNFSQAYLSFPLVIITRQDAPFISGLQDLNNSKIACVKRNISCEWLERDFVTFRPVWVDTPLDALEAVAYGNADIHIENLAAASYYIRQNNLSNLKIAAPTEYGNYELYFAVRKDWPLLVSILNKALNEITPAQHTTIRNKWLSIRYEHGIQKSDLVKWLVPIAFVLLLPGIIFLIWNRRLKMEIAKRIGMGQALQESENTFSAIFHHSPVPITISSLETGEYLDINQEVSAFTGYTREEMIGHTGDQIAIWLKPENRNKLVEAVQKEGTIYNLEFDFKHKSGAIKNGLISGVKITLRNRPCLLLATMDITEQKRTEKALQEVQERYMALFERSLDPIVIYDLNGNLIDANPIACKVMHLSKETMAGKNLADYLDEHQLAKMLNQAGQIVTHGFQKEQQEIKITRPDGQEVWLEIIGSLILQEGVPVAIQGLGRDITERKKAEKEQKSLIHQLLVALDSIKTLKGLLPICANCKKIRDDSGYWNQIESYIEKHSDALFSHSICPDCAQELYGNEPWYKKKPNP